MIIWSLKRSDKGYSAYPKLLYLMRNYLADITFTESKSKTFTPPEGANVNRFLINQAKSRSVIS